MMRSKGTYSTYKRQEVHRWGPIRKKSSRQDQKKRSRKERDRLKAEGRKEVTTQLVSGLRCRRVDTHHGTQHPATREGGRKRERVFSGWEKTGSRGVRKAGGLKNRRGGSQTGTSRSLPQKRRKKGKRETAHATTRTEKRKR